MFYYIAYYKKSVVNMLLSFYFREDTEIGIDAMKAEMEIVILG